MIYPIPLRHTRLYCPTSMTCRSVCGTDAACSSNTIRDSIGRVAPSQRGPRSAPALRQPRPCAFITQARVPPPATVRRRCRPLYRSRPSAHNLLPTRRTAGEPYLPPPAMPASTGPDLKKYMDKKLQSAHPAFRIQQASHCEHTTAPSRTPPPTPNPQSSSTATGTSRARCAALTSS